MVNLIYIYIHTHIYIKYTHTHTLRPSNSALYKDNACLHKSST